MARRFHSFFECSGGRIPGLSRAYMGIIFLAVCRISIPFAADVIHAAESADDQIGTSSSVSTLVQGEHALPKNSPPPATLAFSPHPSEQEIFNAHLFEEPLIAVGGKPSDAENKALASALLAYAGRKSNEDVSPITGFLQANPDSRWNVALLTDLGIVYYHTGHFTKSLDAWGQAWKSGENARNPRERALVDRAVGELAKMDSRLGRYEELESLLKDVANRKMPGAGGVLISHANKALQEMRDRPEICFRCGPLALSRIRHFIDPHAKLDPAILNSVSTRNGTSLSYVAGLAKKLGMNYQMAYREDSSEIPTPCVVNWKAGHYAALIEKKGGRYHSQDPTFGDDLWITPQTLDEQSSGYFLVRAGPLPQGWRTVSDEEGEKVFGKGNTSNNDPNATSDFDGSCAGNNTGGQCQGQGGMADYSFKTMLVSLNITDTPLFYTPPRGPAILFTVTYNQLEANQPATFSYSNLGPQWTFNWLSYITDDPTNPGADVTEYVRGGGTLTFSGYDGTSTYAPEMLSHSVLKITSSTSYLLTAPDGSEQIYSQPDGSASYPRKVFLTRVIDPAGNAIQIAYDANMRITTIKDPLAQVTTLSYGLASDIYKITSVTDPFGRSATFAYNAADTLSESTDMGGLSSAYTYDSTGFINELTTPYGNTIFSNGTGSNRTMWLQATDPNGGTERLEYNERSDVGIPDTEPSQLVPQGMTVGNTYLIYRNTFYWNKEAWQQFPNDYSKAYLTHWLHDTNLATVGRVSESIKPAFENRVTYSYPDQSAFNVVGSSNLPNAVGRVLDDGSTQLSQFQYNAIGNVTQAIDPAGRTTLLTYAGNNIDLLTVQQVNPATSGTDLLATYVYNAFHEPLTAEDASGRKTAYSYNTAGQLLTFTDPKSEKTTFNYNSSGYLTSVVGPLGATGTDTVSFTYDGFGRLQTAADTQGYKLTYAYDSLNRLTKITYPDATTDQFAYNRLDPVTHTDRLGRVTKYTYDALRHLIEVQDPLNRLTYFSYCSCGALDGIIDPLGHATHFQHDAERRLTSKSYSDGSSETYAYENTTSRLKSFTDPKGQVTNYQYYPDDNIHRINYTNSQVNTPGVTFTYDPAYDRITSMEDGTGLTTYSYNPITGSVALGAGLLASVNGPLPDSLVTYVYDALGRVVSRTINGVPQNTVYDALGRVATVVNPLGTFQYAYVSATPRLSSISLPNGQSTKFSYFSNTGDERLQEILNLRSGGATLSKFDYAYNAAGDITTWTQQQDSNPPNSFSFKYDAADQLLSGTSPAASFSYAYDAAGNRLTDVTASGTTTATYNSLNQLTSVTNPSLPAATYQWDAAERLTSIMSGSNTSAFSYDGLGRWVEITEKTNNTLVSDKHFLWCGQELCEERNSTGGVVTKHFYPQGAFETGTSLYYSRDHLGSIRELTGATGAIRARYGYDPYGVRTKISGDLDSDFGFTSFYVHAASGLQLANYRAYDAGAGRWLSRDPIGENSGANLYGYVGSDPIDRIDPFGLDYIFLNDSNAAPVFGIPRAMLVL